MSTVPAGATAPPVRPHDDDARADEVTLLRAEVSALRARLDQRRTGAARAREGRAIAAALLIAITAFALVFSVVGRWSARTALNTDRWVATVVPLRQNPQVAAAVAGYATTQVFRAVDVEQRLRTVLPPQAAFVVGPLAGQLRDTVRRTVDDVSRSDRFQRIWVEINRRAHQRAVAVLEGSSTVVVAGQDRITIDLLPLINQVLRELSAQLPTLFGRQVALPDLSSGAIPENLRVRVQDALGVTLPPDFAAFAVHDSGRLYAAQQTLIIAKRGLAPAAVGTVLLLILAFVVSPGRRRTALQLGLWLVVAAVAVTAVLRAVRTQVLEAVPAGLYRDGVAAAVTTVLGGLRTRGEQIIWIGALLALLAYLVGPGRAPTWVRGVVAAGTRAAGRSLRAGVRAATRSGPGWIAGHLDLLRVGGLVVAVVFALILSSWTALLVVVVGLAAYETGVTAIARSATAHPPPPAAPAGAAPPVD